MDSFNQTVIDFCSEFAYLQEMFSLLGSRTRRVEFRWDLPIDERTLFVRLLKVKFDDKVWDMGLFYRRDLTYLQFMIESFVKRTTQLSTQFTHLCVLLSGLKDQLSIQVRLRNKIHVYDECISESPLGSDGIVPLTVRVPYPLGDDMHYETVMDYCGISGWFSTVKLVNAVTVPGIGDIYGPRVSKDCDCWMTGDGCRDCEENELEDLVPHLVFCIKLGAVRMREFDFSRFCGFSGVAMRVVLCELYAQGKRFDVAVSRTGVRYIHPDNDDILGLKINLHFQIDDGEFILPERMYGASLMAEDGIEFDPFQNMIFVVASFDRSRL